MKKILFLFIIISFCSCERLYFNYYCDKGLKHATRFYVPDTDKEVIVIPVVHLNTRFFYDELDEYIEKKKSEGFVVFREGVLPSFHFSDTLGYISTIEAVNRYGMKAAMREDSVATIEGIMKSRKVLNGMADWKKKNLPRNTKKFYLDTNLHSQPFLSKNPEKEIWADITYGDANAYYESQCGQIILTDYDKNIPLDSAYCRESSDNTFYDKHKYMMSLRDRLLSKRVLASPFPKIIVIYGATHISMLTIHLESKKNHYVKDKTFKIK